MSDSSPTDSRPMPGTTPDSLGAPGPARASSERNLWPWAVAGLAAVAIVAAAITVSLATSGSDDLEVRLEPVGAPAIDPFAPSVASNATNLSGELIVPAPAVMTLGEVDTTSPSPDITTLRGLAPRPAAGATPGLFGGSGDSAACDPESLVAHLDGAPTKAAAWASVFGIPSSEIGSFVAELTPVVLTRDTLVTNHGFRDEQAYRVNSVLAKGTAVLVDDRGVPAVKCDCGNPLLAPPSIPEERTVVLTGQPWRGLDFTQIVEVGVDVRVEVFVLVAINGGTPYSQAVGTVPPDGVGKLSDTDLCDLVPRLCDPGSGPEAPTTTDPPPTTEPPATTEPPPPPVAPDGSNAIRAVESLMQSMCGVSFEPGARAVQESPGIWHVTGQIVWFGELEWLSYTYDERTESVVGRDQISVEFIVPDFC